MTKNYDRSILRALTWSAVLIIAITVIVVTVKYGFAKPQIILTPTVELNSKPPASSPTSVTAVNSQIPQPTLSSIAMIQTPDLNLALLYDPFTDTSDKNGYNSDLWHYGCDGDYCDKSGIKLGDGTMRFEINGVGGVNLYGNDTWWMNQIDYVESKIQVSEYEGVDNGDLHLVVGTDLLTGRWQTLCYIEGRHRSTLGLYYTCSVGSYDFNYKPIYEYYSRSILINFSEWHTTRIKIDPETYEVSFYLDGIVIGSYKPANPDNLKDKKFDVNIGLTAANSYRHIVGAIDDFLVMKRP